MCAWEHEKQSHNNNGFQERFGVLSQNSQAPKGSIIKRALFGVCGLGDVMEEYQTYLGE
jgi:hypothetical protein